MKKLILVIFLFLLFAPIYSQSQETVKLQIDDLEEAKINLQNQIKDIDSRLGELNKKMHELKVKVDGNGHRGSTISATKLYDQPIGGTVKANVPEKTSLVIDERDQNSYKTSFNNMVGYVPAYQIKFENSGSEKILQEEANQKIRERIDKRNAEREKQTEEIERKRQLEAQQRSEQMQQAAAVAKKEKEQRIEQMQQEAAAAKKEKEQRIRAKYNSSDAERILSHRIWLGMTKEMLIDSRGKPNDYNINRSVGSWGVHEQWVYSGIYIYLENGKVTSWQD